MLVIQKEEAKLSLTPDIALKNVGINPYLKQGSNQSRMENRECKFGF